MLIPAISRKEEVLKEFSKIVYTEDYYYYAGYAHCHYLPEIKAEDDNYQWISVDKDDNICGYIAYRINSTTDRVYNFGLISFDHKNLTFGFDVKKHIEKLVQEHKTLEWRMIDGNPVQKHYDKLIKEYNGQKFKLHNVCKDLYNNLRDEWIYEIYREI